MAGLSNTYNGFFSCFSDENNERSPIQYLLDLWKSSEQETIMLIEEAVNNFDNYRSIAQCICIVALKLSDKRVTAIIENASLKNLGNPETSRCLVLTAVLLGSEKIKERFCEEFKKTFSYGFGHYSYNDFITTSYLEIIALAKYTDAQEIVSEMLSIANVERKVAKNYSAVKLGEAILCYFNGKAVQLRQYLDGIGNKENKAFQYLYCLACNRDQNDVNFFLKFLNNYNELNIKNICNEAIVYISDNQMACELLNKQLESIDLNKAVRKKGGDFKILYLNRQPLLKSLMTICYYLEDISDELGKKMILLSNARDSEISSLSNVIMSKFKIKQKRVEVGKDQLMLLEESESPAGLLSLAKGII